LKLVVTGMHLDPAHGRTVSQIKKDGWPVAATVPWRPAGSDRTALARETALATAKLADALAEIEPDVVLVTGDRVEAFAASAAAHLSGKLLAHVHGGDRAQGQVDDTLRHAITKLAHLHFPATRQSAERIEKLGEDSWRIRTVGSPGLDDIVATAWPLAKCVEALREAGRWSRSAEGAALVRQRYALLVLHPSTPDDREEETQATRLLRAVQTTGFERVVIVYPNNDPGAKGILRAWETATQNPIVCPDLPRPAFLGLLRDAACLVGNSSSGIIEAASFGTPALDVGPRQAGRERGENVTTVSFAQGPVRQALKTIWNDGRPARFATDNPYGDGQTARRIADTLASIPLSAKWRQKLITY
jgi:UDP-N-acetylglucosamine 2-epimerase (non-hydrolysing)/GDP/UDP-N,N'-diacetylbacillosamine 2-epimerase (hydrolysing)